MLAQHLVVRLGVDLDRLLAVQPFQQPQAGVEAVGAGDHHRRQVRALVGAGERGDRHHAVHEGPGDDCRDLADDAVPDPLPRGDELATEALGVADHGVDAAVLDGAQHVRRVDGVRGQRLLDEQVVSTLDAGQNGVHVPVLVGRDDDGVDLGPGDELAEVPGREVGPGVGGQRPKRAVVDVADAEPADRRVLAGQFGPDAADGAAADDGEAELIVDHVVPSRFVPVSLGRSGRVVRARTARLQVEHLAGPADRPALQAVPEPVHPG